MKISVVLEALTGKFDTDINRSTKDAERRMKAFKKNVADTARQAAIAFTAFSGAVAVGLNKALKDADDFAKTSQQIGVSVEALSGLSFAAGQAGTDVESLTKGMGRLSRVTKDAATGLKTAVRPFEQLGIEFQNADGTLRATEDLLLDVADKFSTMADGTTKAALAQELFGRAGLKLIPLLNEGRGGIEELTAQAERLGLVMDTQTARAAEVFNDNLSALGGAITGVFRNLTAQLAPSLVAISSNLLNSAENTSAFEVAAERLASVIRGLAATGAVLSAAFSVVGSVIGGVAAAVVQAAQGQFRMAGNILGEIRADIEKNVEELTDTFEALFNPPEINIPDAASPINSIVVQSEQAANAAKKAAEAQKKALEDARSTLQGMIADNRQAIDTFGDSEDVVIAYRLATGDLADKVRLLGEEGEEYARILQEQTLQQLRMTEAQEAAEEQAKKVADALKTQQDEAARIFDSTRTPLENFQKEIENLNALLEKGLINRDTYERAVKQSQDVFDEISKRGKDAFFDIEEAAKQATRNIHDSLADFLYDPFQDGLDGMLSGFIDMLRRMAAEAAAAQILEGLGGFSGVGGFFTSLFGGARAQGGPVSAGRSYLVGERGPEMFVPSTSGQIVPNGGGGDVTVNLYESSSKAGNVNRRTDRAGQDIIDIFVSDIRGGGQAAAAIESTFGTRRVGR